MNNHDLLSQIISIVNHMGDNSKRHGEDGARKTELAKRLRAWKASCGVAVGIAIDVSDWIIAECGKRKSEKSHFVVWERCCRNYTITNIYTQQPQGTNIAAGQTFYLEFPPVVKDGQPFINSSPRLFPPLNDFACPFRPYYVDFAGVDDDGDSLVYSLVTPLNTTSAVALPTPSPGPFPEVKWRPGYGLFNIINGKPDLRISREGLLTATPRTQGLFVFAVKIDEFRSGEKIGESRRDFQMLVVDACPQVEPPQILGKKLLDPEFTFDENMSVSFINTVSDHDRCIQPDAPPIESVCAPAGAVC